MYHHCFHEFSHSDTSLDDEEVSEFLYNCVTCIKSRVIIEETIFTLANATAKSN